MINCLCVLYVLSVRASGGAHEDGRACWFKLGICVISNISLRRKYMGECIVTVVGRKINTVLNAWLCSGM